MKRTEFRQMIADRILVFDGAMGTMVQQAMPQSLRYPEQAITEYPDILGAIHAQYAKAGCHVIQTNTFGANRLKLGAYDQAGNTVQINTAAAKLTRRALNGFSGVFVAGDIGPTGKLLAPLGPLSFAEAVDVFREQARALADGGADLIIIETMSDVHEAKAAAVGARLACDLPIIVSMTYGEDLHTLTGSTPEVAAVVLDALDIDAIGANCGFGPDMFLEIMEQYARVTDLPLLAQPNAGLPQWCNGACSFSLDAQDMADCVENLVRAGATMIGGCCGTTPDHLRAMAATAQNLKPAARKRDGVTRLAGTTTIARIGDGPTRVIGECINVSARKNLVEAVRDGNYAPIVEEAMEQCRHGADVIDVNMGLKLQNITEKQAMLNSLQAIQRSVGIPVAIDTVDSETLEEALQHYRGKALINSTNGEDEHLDRTLTLAKRYGAAVLGLTLDHGGIPSKAEDRYAIAEKIVSRALKIGIRREDVFIDTLTLTAGSKQELVPETIKALAFVKEKLGVRTILGVSNISHGLPNRADLTSAFITVAIQHGLDMPIVNPKLRSVWSAVRTGDVLAGRDRNAVLYIEWASANPHDAASTDNKTSEHTQLLRDKESEHSPLMNAVIKGDKPGALAHINALRHAGQSAVEIVNQHLIPALELVGERYEKRIFFLPQLLTAAEAAQAAFDVLADDLAQAQSSHIGTFVLATVKGDMHDIGKNIVAVMLRNHGFRVIDLGRDVSAEDIVAAAVREQADLVGLSSLMTTTMTQMETVAGLMAQRGCVAPLMVGGAVVTPDYAAMIGAHYSSDAVDAVRVAKQLLSKK